MPGELTGGGMPTSRTLDDAALIRRDGCDGYVWEDGFFLPLIAGGSGDAGGDAGTDTGTDAGSGTGGTGEGDKGAAGGSLEEKVAALEKTIGNLRAFERGEKLPKKVQTELEELRTFRQQAEEADKTESQKLAGRIAEMEREVASRDVRIQELTLRQAVAREAQAAGALYPDDTWKLIDLARVETDDDGTPKNLDKLVGELKESHSALFRNAAGSADGGARTSVSGDTPDMNKLLRIAATGQGD